MHVRLLDFSEIQHGGDILNRLQLNFQRLHQAEYLPSQVFVGDASEWPGDKEGRLLLALVLLSRALHLDAAHAHEIFVAWPDHLNCKGYFGATIDNVINEQQWSGNSWAIRGLIEYYLWTGNDKSINMVEDMVHNLYLPAAGKIRTYPVSLKDRTRTGGVGGHLTGACTNGWLTSTDIGCVFIALDGLTHAQSVLQMAPLQRLIEEMIDTLGATDIVACSFQTHATLSALRGILRYSAISRDSRFVDVAKSLYQLYMGQALTETYANYNWFDRPAWTEPCAVIDSLLAALELWRVENNPQYLEDAHHIYYNGLVHGQRPNGGFGCDCCVGPAGSTLHPQEVFEATFCCTMRGGEGLSRLSTYHYAVNQHSLYLIFFGDHDAQLRVEDDLLSVRQSSTYPNDGFVQLEVLNTSTTGAKRFCFFCPSWIARDSVRILVNGRPHNVAFENGFAQVQLIAARGDVITYTFDIGLRTVPVLNSSHASDLVTLRHGSLILGVQESEAVNARVGNHGWKRTDNGYECEGPVMRLLPLNSLTYLSMKEARKSRVQVLFRREPSVARDVTGNKRDENPYGP